MKSIAIIILTIAYNDLNDKSTITHYVDAIELNHMYDDDGKVSLDQVIFWYQDQVIDYRPCTQNSRRYNKEAEKKAINNNDVYNPEWVGTDMRPIKCGNWYISCFFDHKDSVRRKIYTKIYKESWTQFDPELVQRIRQGRSWGLSNAGYYLRSNYR